MKILVIAEHDNIFLKPATLSCINAALAISQNSDASINVLVAGHQCHNVAEETAHIESVKNVLLADAPALGDFLPENLARQVLTLAKDYSHVIAATTAIAKSYMPRVAALLGVAQISDIIAVEAPDIFVRPIYAGNALATVQSLDAVKVITVRTTAFPAIKNKNQDKAVIECIPAVNDSGLSRRIEQNLTQNDRPELTSAKVIVSGGRGMQSAENFHLLEALASKLDAALGASRAAVDAGYAPNDYQVGQTGKIVAPQLYIAVGISGAIQHLAGMKDSKVIVAINKDPEAPIFQIADYGLVADALQAVPELVAAL